jgi:hypothetical protein
VQILEDEEQGLFGDQLRHRVRQVVDARTVTLTTQVRRHLADSRRQTLGRPTGHHGPQRLPYRS